MFRSKQEEKWAKFFDLVGIKYIHNPEHVKIDNDFSYSPSFYLPDVDTSFTEKFESHQGVYFDVITDDDFPHWSLSDRFSEPLVTGNLLPLSRDEDAYSLSSDHLVDNNYSFMRMFESVVLAEPHYHTLKQERWLESEKRYDKDRMMIPFYEAQEAEDSVS